MQPSYFRKSIRLDEVLRKLNHLNSYRRYLYRQIGQHRYNSVISFKATRNFARQFMTWSAMFMLLAQPVGAQGADCGCSSANEVSTGTCCSVADTCCGSAENSCCSKASSCCSATNVADTPCSCGDECQCGAADGNHLPNPAIPVSDTTSQQTQILALANQTISEIDSTTFGDEFPRAESASPFSLTAQQVCALLSRFTC